MMTKSKFVVEFSFVNKDGKMETFEDECVEWDLIVSVSRTLRKARQTVLKGRRDVNNLSLNIKRLPPEETEEEFEQEPEEEILISESVCGMCGTIVPIGEGYCDKCYEKMIIK